MGLEAVKEEILNSAREQANRLIAEARKSANKIMREAEVKVEQMKENSEDECNKITETLKRQEFASAELANKKSILEEKKQMIDSVFAEAKKRIGNLGEKKRETYLKKLLERAKKDLEVVNVYCDKKDSKFFKGFSVENIEITGGLISENEDKSIRVDYSFDTMLDTIKENELQNINKILFE